MAELRTDHSLFTECLAAMSVAGDAYPCDTLAPVPQAECELPAVPGIAGQSATAPIHHAKRT
ncbi:MAG: hypothetical protein WBA92_00785 [Pseudorhodobacter sp.]